MKAADRAYRVLAWGVAGAVILLASIVAGVVGLDKGDKIAGIVGLVVSILFGINSFGNLRAYGRAELVDRAYTYLASEIALDWKREIVVHKLSPSDLLNVRWDRMVVGIRSDGNAAGHLSLRAMTQWVPELRRLAGHAQSGEIATIVSTWKTLSTQQLVICGRPGAGKTSLAVVLANGLINAQNRASDDPIPVLFPLASWNPCAGQDFDQWLAGRLVEQYPMRTGSRAERREVASQLLKQGRILPILDGLDELSTVQRGRAITMLNESEQGGRPTIITCRAQEYRSAAAAGENPLPRAIVIELRPVTAAQVSKYLRKEQYPGDERWSKVIQHLRNRPGSVLADTLSNPLMVSLVRTIYSAHDARHAAVVPHPDVLCDQEWFTNRDVLQAHLFEGLISTVYRQGWHDRDCRWTAADASRWLGFLARSPRFQRQENERGRTERELRPDISWWQFGEDVPRWLIGGSVGATIGLGYGLVVGIGARIGVQAGVGLLPGIVCALLTGLVIRRRITALRGSGAGLAGGLVGGLVGGWIAGVAGAHGIGVAKHPTSAFPAGLGVGVWVGPAVGLSGGLIGSATGGFVAGLLVEVGRGVPAGIANGLAVALATGVAVGLPQPRPPAGGIRWSPIAWLASLAATVAVGTAAISVAGVWWALGCGGLAGVLTALVAGLTRDNIDLKAAAKPKTAFTRDRQTFAFIWLAFCVAALFVACLISGLGTVQSRGTTPGVSAVIRAGLAIAIVVGIGLGTVAAFGQTAWGHFTVARCWLAIRGDLPWSLMSFLADAHERGVLRQVGATYQFRHCRLQHYLARRRTASNGSIWTRPTLNSPEQRHRTVPVDPVGDGAGGGGG